MSEERKFQFSWLFVAVAVVSGSVLLYGWSPAGASGDHDKIRYMQQQGNIVSLSVLLEREELRDMKVLEAELDNEHGQMVYELELLDSNGKVYERYYDAVTGEPLNTLRED